MNDGLNKLKNSGLIKKVICSDTHMNTQTINDELLKVRSIANLISDRIKKSGSAYNFRVPTIKHHK
ncbi:hypothetical protein [Fulvivirga marina]|uniref:hypothetical protein n=1 Tax=Fulvivirga marina TaxID=2494733 RepID=UPI00293D9AF1|nr:hypothetical protein [Fulvivirga marina]